MPVQHQPEPRNGEGSRPESFFHLRESAGRLELRSLNHPRYGPVSADWTAPEIARRIRAGRKALLPRAIGLARYDFPKVLDGTAGLGRDGFVLAALGAQVTMVERHATVVALLRDAHRRALADSGTAAAAARIEIVHADCRTLLADRWDVVFLDPMYPGRGRHSLARKELQVLRELTQGDADAGELLAPALDSAQLRVTVKRDARAPPLAGRAPSFSLSGSQARFDVYLPASMPSRRR